MRTAHPLTLARRAVLYVELAAPLTVLLVLDAVERVTRPEPSRGERPS